MSSIKKFDTFINESKYQYAQDRNGKQYNLFQQTNDVLDKNFMMPTIYITRMYYQYYQKYRSLIKKIVMECDNETLTEWCIFNLRRLEEQIWNNSGNVEKILKKKI